MRVFIKKYSKYANVVSTIKTSEGETLYWCDNTFGLGRIFSAKELIFS